MAEGKRSPCIVRETSSVPALPVARSRGARIQVLLGPDEGMPRFYTRLFTIDPGGRIPEHLHDAIEHEQVVLEGELTLSLDGDVRTVVPGQCVYIPAGCAHWYENRGSGPVRFLCMIPGHVPYTTEWKEDAD